MQLNAVLQNRNLARVYHRSLAGCQASHLKSTFHMIIRLWVPELGQYRKFEQENPSFECLFAPTYAVEWPS